MVDSFIEGIRLQVLLVLLATTAVALVIVAATSWGWWKWRQVAGRARAVTRRTRNGHEFGVARFAGPGSAGGRTGPPYEPETGQETDAGPTGPTADPGGTPPPRSETRELLEQARRYATQRAQEIGERLRPEIDRAQQRIEQSAAMRDAAARLRSVREAWDRPAADTSAGGAGVPTAETDVVGRRLDELVEQQRITNELLRALLERLSRT